MNIKDAKSLYFDTARFFLERVKLSDHQTVNDVLAILGWPEYKKSLKWAASHGAEQVHCNAIMDAGVVLTELKMALRIEKAARPKTTVTKICDKPYPYDEDDIVRGQL